MGLRGSRVQINGPCAAADHFSRFPHCRGSERANAAIHIKLSQPHFVLLRKLMESIGRILHVHEILSGIEWKNGSGRRETRDEEKRTKNCGGNVDLERDVAKLVKRDDTLKIYIHDDINGAKLFI